MKSVKVFILTAILPAVVPLVAEFAAAADVGVGEDEAAVQEGKPRGGEADGKGVAVGSVGVDVKAVARCLMLDVSFGEFVAAVDEAYRDAGAVVSGDPEAFGGVEGAVEVAGDLLLFEQGGGVGLGVVLVDAGG